MRAEAVPALEESPSEKRVTRTNNHAIAAMGPAATQTGALTKDHRNRRAQM